MPGFYGGAPANVATATVVPLVPPARLRQLAIAVDSVTLGWDQAAGSNGAPLSYRVVYEHLPTAIMYQVEVLNSGAIRSGFTVTGLNNGEPYRFAIQVTEF